MEALKPVEGHSLGPGQFAQPVKLLGEVAHGGSATSRLVERFPEGGYRPYF